MLNVGGIITVTASARVHPNIANSVPMNETSVTATTPDNQPADNQTVSPVILFIAPAHKSYLPAVRQ
ncbi:MAG: hypothetical protein R3E79_11950 [Caldilineaceae bacterium]